MLRCRPTRSPGAHWAAALLPPCHSTPPRRPYITTHAVTSAASQQDAQQRVDALFHNSMQRKVLMLERSIRPNKLDTALWETSAFAAEVYPDIPLLTSWKDVQKLAAPLTTPSSTPSSSTSPATPAVVPSPHREGQWLVHTMGVQTRRNTAQLQEALLAKAGVVADAAGDAVHSPRPDALLVVSGSHLLRRVPGVSGLFSNSVQALHLANQLRAQGTLPPSLALWCVDNPLLSVDASRLEAKADAGAQVVLTQPPLLWDAFTRWAEDVQRRDLHTRLKLVIGLPMLSSATNAAFWLQLCHAAGQPGASALLADLHTQERAAGSDPQALQGLYEGINRRMVDKVLEVPGVAGLHVMPLTALARRITLGMLGDGSLPGGTCRPMQRDAVAQA